LIAIIRSGTSTDGDLPAIRCRVIETPAGPKNPKKGEKISGLKLVSADAIIVGVNDIPEDNSSPVFIDGSTQKNS